MNTTIPNDPQLGSAKKFGDLTVPSETVNEIQDWVQSCSFDDDDMLDIFQETTIDGYQIELEHFTGASADHVSVSSDDEIALLEVPELLEL